MTGDTAIRRLTAAAVLLVAAIAATVSFIHIEHLAVTHGQSALAAVLLPVSVDGAVASASLTMLYAARNALPTPWLARGMLVLAVSATLAANVAFGAPYGLTGGLISGWPAIAFVGSVESALRMVRSARKPAVDAVAHVAADAESAARVALAASIAAGNPLSQRQLMTRFGLTRTAATRVRQDVTAQSNGRALTTAVQP